MVTVPRISNDLMTCWVTLGALAAQLLILLHARMPAPLASCSALIAKMVTQGVLVLCQLARVEL